LWENTTAISPPHVKNCEDFHLTETMADNSITWMDRHLALNPDRPFFMWWTPGAAHGPHHVAKKWADTYKGKFNDGWDVYQKRIFERQKAMGWIPALIGVDHDQQVRVSGPSGSGIAVTLTLTSRPPFLQQAVCVISFHNCPSRRYQLLSYQMATSFKSGSGKTNIGTPGGAFTSLPLDALRSDSTWMAPPAAHSGWLEPGRNGADFLTPRYPAPTPLFTPPAQT